MSNIESNSSQMANQVEVPNEMVIVLTKSPKNRDCIGMTQDGEVWLLLTTSSCQSANEQRNQLTSEFGIKPILSLGVDIIESLETKSIVIHDNSDILPTNGIYVKPEDFDPVMDTLQYKHSKTLSLTSPLQ